MPDGMVVVVLALLLSLAGIGVGRGHPVAGGAAEGK